MPSQPNTNYSINTSDKVVAIANVKLLGPTASATMGAFTVPDGVMGDIDFVIGGLTTETVTVAISQDGTNWSAALKPVQGATGKDHPTTTMTTGYYTLPVLRFGSPKFVKFTKSAAVEVASVAVAVPTVSRMW